MNNNNNTNPIPDQEIIDSLSAVITQIQA